MLLSPAFDSAIMFKDLHFNTTSMKRVTCLPRSSAGELLRPLLFRIESHTHTRIHTHSHTHKQMHYRSGYNAKLLRNCPMSNKGGMKQREMLGDVEWWTFSRTQEYSLSLRKNTKQILFPKALCWILPSNRVGFIGSVSFNFHLLKNFHVGTHNINLSVFYFTDWASPWCWWPVR